MSGERVCKVGWPWGRDLCVCVSVCSHCANGVSSSNFCPNPFILLPVPPAWPLPLVSTGTLSPCWSEPRVGVEAAP